MPAISHYHIRLSWQSFFSVQRPFRGHFPAGITAELSAPLFHPIFRPATTRFCRLHGFQLTRTTLFDSRGLTSLWWTSQALIEDVLEKGHNGVVGSSDSPFSLLFFRRAREEFILRDFSFNRFPFRRWGTIVALVPKIVPRAPRYGFARTYFNFTLWIDCNWGAWIFIYFPALFNSHCFPSLKK